MEREQAFVGFQEAPIDFPPTFKYDVLRTLKRPKHGSRPDRWRGAGERSQPLTEVEEKEKEIEYGEDDDADEEGEGENASLSSSAWTSTHSRLITEGDDDELDSPLMSQGTTPGSKVSLSLAAHKAKIKWLSILSPSIPTTPARWLKMRHSPDLEVMKNHKPHSSIDIVGEIKTPLREERAISLDGAESRLLKPPPLGRVSSTKSSVPSEDEDGKGDVDKGVYDSSHKKRVPSWCVHVLHIVICKVDSPLGAIAYCGSLQLFPSPNPNWSRQNHIPGREREWDNSLLMLSGPSLRGGRNLLALSRRERYLLPPQRPIPRELLVIYYTTRLHSLDLPTQYNILISNYRRISPYLIPHRLLNFLSQKHHHRFHGAILTI